MTGVGNGSCSMLLGIECEPFKTGLSWYEDLPYLFRDIGIKGPVFQRVGKILEVSELGYVKSAVPSLFSVCMGSKGLF